MSVEIDQTKQETKQSSASKSSHCSCPACGQLARRVDARFCSACGRSLEESYLPADALRASYNAPHRRVISKSAGGQLPKPLKKSMSSLTLAQKRNSAATTALAFVTYALVPYLGILFCPGALLMSSIGIYNSYRAPAVGGRKSSYLYLASGLLILGAQLFLWWMLYKIPQWRRMG